MDTTTLHGRCFEVTPNGVLIFETFLSCYQPCKKLFQTKSYWFDIDKYNHAGLILGSKTRRKSIFISCRWWYTMYHGTEKKLNALLCFTFLFIEIKWHFLLKLTFILSPYNFYDLAGLDIESFKFLGVWFETQLKLV